jgi:hypothetical protein
VVSSSIQSWKPEKNQSFFGFKKYKLQKQFNLERIFSTNGAGTAILPHAKK